MEDYEAYLFDWDGTIARTLEAWITVMRKSYETFGLRDLTDDQVVQSLGRLKPASLEYGIHPDTIDAFYGYVETLSHQEIPRSDLYEDAIGGLESLKNRNKKLALISTSWRKTLEALLRKHNLSDVFDIVITGEDVAKHKPDPEGIIRAIEFLGVQKDKAVMIADSPHDIGAASNAGIDSILFYPPSHQLFYQLDSLKRHHPTYTISGWNELA